MANLFQSIQEHKYSQNECFLCGANLNEKNHTEEHVMPKWLQHRFNLWDQGITLLNGTFLPYRALTIPCCFECNNKFLRPFEDKISAAFKNGFEEFQKLDKETLFLWLGKIYFGIAYREQFLNIDRKKPEKGTILNPEYLKSFKSHLIFLQGIRKKHKCSNFFPSSIYLFKTQVPSEVKLQWDFIDNHNVLFISVRMADIGLIAALQDGETTKQLEYLLDKYRSIDLHPLQFREITAKILYKTLLMNRIPKFIHTENNDSIESYMSPLQGMTDKSIFDDWDNDFFAKILSEVTKVPLNVCQRKKGTVWTWLHNEKGEPIFIDINESN